MSKTVNLIEIDPTTDERWRAVVSRQSSDIFHSPTWLRVLRDTYDMDIRANVLLDDDGRPEAGVPFVIIADLRGERVVALPFSDYCDPLVNDREQWDELIAPLLQDDRAIFTRCLHCEIPRTDERFTVTKRARWHGLDLGPDLDQLWASLDGSGRRAIRKAQRQGVTTRIATDESDLRAFFDLHLGIRKHKYRLLAQPYRFFENIWRGFNQQGKAALMVAVHAGAVIGAVMYLEYGDTLYYKFSASSSAHLELRPTDLLIWDGIQLAKARGLRKLDFGLSDWDQDGLVRYKRKFASEEKTISFLLRPSSRPPTLQEREVGALLSTFTNLLTEPSVPDEVTERGGNAVYRFFT